MFKKNFLFIILISIMTLVVLVVGAFTLYKDTSLEFASDGYIIETSTKTNTKYYFSANTKYKENVDDKIAFEDKENKKVSVDPASFVHYNNGNVSFLKKGALVNLTDITSPMVSYYNITKENTIVYEKEHYTVISNDKKINIDSFIGRINDNKYIIAGKNIELKIPTENNRIIGDYFEVNYIEEGIVKIDNKENSFQVTAQDSYIYIGENITINLGDGKIFHNGDAKMIMSQITINNNENIDLDVEEQKGGSGGGSGEGAGEGLGTDGENKNHGEDGEGDGEGDGTGIGEGAGEGDGTSDGQGGEGTGSGTGEGNKTSDSVKIELREAIVKATSIKLGMQLNNANFAKGDIVAYLINTANGEIVTCKIEDCRIELKNGEFTLDYTGLTPNTTYVLKIGEKQGNKKEIQTQYFQKIFITNDLGITLEKIYATSNSLSYKLNFDASSEVTEATIRILDSSYTIKKADKDNTIIFDGLKSNTSYSVEVTDVVIDKANYSGVYTINRIDSTLKETPEISGINVNADAEEVKFTIELKNVKDKDKSIISYTYNVYLADDITLENTNPKVQYTITKNDSDPLVLNLNQIDELKTGIDYRAKIIAQYNDNEMIREVSTDYSSNFLIRSKPNIIFEQKSATMNKVEGTISLQDANCTVPMVGRSCHNLANNFTLRYYELTEEETTENDRIIHFDSKKLTSDLVLEDLKSHTTYAVKVFGNYFDDDNQLHSNVQIGDTFYVSTDKSENIYFEVIGDNVSGQDKNGNVNINNVITFDAKLSAPQNSTIMEEISTVTFNLYNGRYNTKDKLIGKYTIKDISSIQDLFSNITITNSLFTDTTNKNKIEKLNTIEKLIKATNNSTSTLNASYTVEVEDVYDSTGLNKITVENNIYTFNLTPSYYLDARIATNPNNAYLTVTPILKENLTEEEYEKLSKTVKNLDQLKNKTVVGLTIENSLSDIFVDSAYDYEKAIVKYTICNNTKQDCDGILRELTDNNPDNDEIIIDKIKLLSVDMGNKYQPKSQTIYLDSSEYTDYEKYFIRGYNYKIGFYISFTMEDGSTPHYTHDKLHQILPIERQNPLFTQYISKSTDKDIIYRYSFKDVDSALANNNFYYTLGDNKEKYYSVENTLNKDGEYHNVTLPINNRNTYTLYYARKNTKDEIEYVEMTSNDFEKEYSYDSRIAYTILNGRDNILKIKLEDNDVTNRAYAYKVVIKANDDNSLTDYTRYFLASKLTLSNEETGTFDTEGNPITRKVNYINIDYANISKFMGHNLSVTVYSYFDSGLKGYNQDLNNGFILKNRLDNKYLNIYNAGSSTTSTSSIDDLNMGLYILKEEYKQDGKTMFIYNKLMNTRTYNPLLGAAYYDTNELSPNIGVNFKTLPTNAGMILTHNKNDYLGYDVKSLKEVELLTQNNTYKFDTIIPTININAKDKNTINSITINMTPSGIYGNKQIKDNKIYVEQYSDIECTTLLNTKETNINVTGNETSGYTATLDEVEFTNLKPATKYYFKVFAYIKGEKTYLYDNNTTNNYNVKTYEASTLNNLGIIQKINFSVSPINYEGENSLKQITWKLNLKNTRNYKLRFELYKPDGTYTETNPETGEEVIKNTYKAVKFDGSDANSCNIDESGTSTKGYAKNCYILVDKDNVEEINKKDINYTFTSNDFVFGGNYYKMIVYAIPYTNGKYVEEDKVLLYQNDSLTTTPTIQTVNGVQQEISVPLLEEPTFTLSNSLKAGYVNQSDGYYISFVPTVNDKHKVIKYGSYTVKLKDEKGNPIQTLTNVTKGIPETGSIGNTEIKFTGLTSNTLYYIELSYETYRNNLGYTEEQKTMTTPFTDFIYTPISNDITLGTITAGSATGKGVVLTYNGSANLSEKIVRVDYKIQLKNGSSITTGTYKIDSNNSNIFVVSTDKTPKLTIDTSNSAYSTNTNFTFKTGSTYIITTQYYYLNNNGVETLLKDQVTNNTTYTTILNL